MLAAHLLPASSCLYAHPAELARVSQPSSRSLYGTAPHRSNAQPAEPARESACRVHLNAALHVLPANLHPAGTHVPPSRKRRLRICRHGLEVLRIPGYCTSHTCSFCTMCVAHAERQAFTDMVLTRYVLFTLAPSCHHPSECVTQCELLTRRRYVLAHACMSDGTGLTRWLLLCLSRDIRVLLGCGLRRSMQMGVGRGPAVARVRAFSSAHLL